jgi:hypothetical protein
MTFIADRVTNVPVPFRQLRMKDAEGALQEGVVGATDLKVVQRAAGADQSVDFSIGAAWIRIDSGTRNGLVHVYNDAVANVAATAANGTNPRVDIAVVRYNDSSIPAGTGGNTPTPEILQGAATAGAQVITPGAAGYRAGAPALPNDCMLVADILRPTATNPITTANIVDRRPWARGAFILGVKPGAVAIPITTAAELDTAVWKVRIEASGVPLRLALSPAQLTLVSANSVTLTFWQDGSPITTATQQITNNTTATNVWNAAWSVVVVPPAGSHLYSVAAVYTGGASAPTIAQGTFVVEEIVRQNATNT